MITRFNYERRYKKRGIFIDCRWFVLRFYPPVLPTWTFWPKRTVWLNLGDRRTK